MAVMMPEVTDQLDADDVLVRVDNLRRTNQGLMAERLRIRQIMNGGAEGIKALLGRNTNLPQDDMPVVHLLDSGLTRLAQKLGRRPDVKVDPRPDRDSRLERKRADKRARIVDSYDYNDRLELQLPQVARWLPGYGFAVWTLRQRQDGDGFPYPSLQIRDPYDCYPGWWGPDQQPTELAVVRRVPPELLAERYPAFATSWAEKPRMTGGLTQLATTIGESSWEGDSDGAILVEYFDKSGTYIIAWDTSQVLDFIPNPMEGPAFVVVKRFAFDRLMGQYNHSIGLMAQMAKLNVLGLTAAEDSVYRETNIIGELEGNSYKRGRFATNFFAPGSRIEKPSDASAFQTFQQIDRIERQLRVGANYSVIDDAQSPNSFVTGQGLDRLQSGGDQNVAEYQLSLKHALEMADSKRLEWDEVMYGSRKKPLLAVHKGVVNSETYTPSSDIKGHYRTRRVYGVMASWDDPAKVVTGLQLLQGRIIDIQTFQENLYGLEEIGKINERRRRDETEQHLLDTLKQLAFEKDPAATQALVEIYESPEKMGEILKKFFTPEEPQLSPEEQQFLQPNPLEALAGGGGGAPPSVSTVLSQLESSGETGGGVQTVGRL